MMMNELDNKALTLLELIIIMAIIGILATAVIQNLVQYKNKKYIISPMSPE